MVFSLVKKRKNCILYSLIMIYKIDTKAHTNPCYNPPCSLHPKNNSCTHPQWHTHTHQNTEGVPLIALTVDNNA